MKVLTSRVVVCAIVSILMASAVRAEDKVGTGGVMAKSGDVETPSRSGSTPAIDYKVVTSKAYVDNEISALAAHKVNGVAISNENNQFYAEETARNSGSSATKTVRLSGGGMDSDATTIPTGMILVIKPGETSTVVPTTLKLKRTSSDTTGISKSLRYNGAAITADMAGKVWNANTPSIWVFDGTNWNFVGGGTVADGLIDGLASHTVNGAPLSNLASTFYGSGTGADGEMKQVSISSIDSTTTDVLPPTGLIIVVQPTAKDTRGRFRLRLNSFLPAPVFYRGEPVNENNVEQVWNKKFPSTFVFDGTNWVFLGTVDTDTNTEYSAMSVNEGTTGTATDQRTLTAANLKPIIQGTTLTNIDTTATTNTVSASDTITTGIGKLQGQLTDLSSHIVNGQALSNNQITLYGTSNAAANQAIKTVTLYDYSGDTPTPIQMDSIVPGTVIVVKPDYTHNNAGTAISAIRISNVSGDRGHVIKYDGGSIPTTQYEKLWNADHPSVFVYDGTNWIYVSGGKNAGVRTLEWANNDTVHPAAINNYSTTFDNTTGNWYTNDSDKIADGKFLAESLALKQNKLPAAFLDIANLNGTTNSPFSLRAVITSDDSATDVTNSALGILTVNDVAELAATNVMGSFFNANEDYFDDHNISNRYSDLDKMVPTVAAVGEALHELQTSLSWTAMPWTSDEIASAAAYDTTFVGDTGATANAWPAADKTKLVNGETFAKGLALKQNKLPAQDNNLVPGQMVIDGGPSSVIAPTTAGNVTQVALWDADSGDSFAWDINTHFSNDEGFTNAQRSAIRNSIPTVSAVEAALSSVLGWNSTLASAIDAYSTTFDSSYSTHVAGNWPYLGETRWIKGTTFANSLARKQNKIPATSTVIPLDQDGTVIGTTNNAGEVKQIALWNAHGDQWAWNIDDSYSGYTAEQRLAIRQSIPTVAAVELGLASVRWSALGWDSTFPAAIDSYSMTFDSSSTHTDGNWPYQGANKLVNGTTFANSLARKQNILPAKLASGDTAPSGGMTIDLTTSPGVVGTRYITAGGSQPLTQKTEADNVMLYINGTKTLAEYQTSNFGGTGSTATTNQNNIKKALVSLELLKDVYSALHSEVADTLTWGSSETSSTNAYDTTFVGDTGATANAWPAADKNKLINTAALAQGLSLKQNKIATELITFQDFDQNTYTVPALAVYETATGVAANKFGIVRQTDLTAAGGGIYTFADDWDDGSMVQIGDEMVPTVRAVANELELLQTQLPGLYTSTTTPLTMKSKGGEAVVLGSYAGGPGRRYITSSGSEPLTAKSTGTPDPVLSYINGTKTLAQFQTSNFGATGGTATTIQGRIKESLVNLETLKDVYSELQASIEDSDISSHKVNGAPLSNTASYFYGEGVGAENTETKTVTISSITGTPAVGQFIIVKPATTNTASSIKINLNNTTAYNVLYRGNSSNIPQEVWTAYTPSIFVLDETSGGTKYWRYVGTLPEAMAWNTAETNATKAYSTTFDGTTGNWPTADEKKYIKGNSFAQGLSLKQNVLPVQASGAPVTIPTYPEYGDNPGEIGQMYLDTSTLYTSDDTHFPSSKLVNTTLSLYVPKADAYNTTNLNSDLSTNYTGAPSWATSNGVTSLYRVPDAASGTNWAATALSTWSSDKIVPTMDTLARSLAGLYDAFDVSFSDHTQDYDQASSYIQQYAVPSPSQIRYTGESKLDDGNQLFWLPQLHNAGVEDATRLLKEYSHNRIVPTMDELAYALDGVLQTHETTNEWQRVAAYYRLDTRTLKGIAKLINGSDPNAVALNDSGYLQTFAPSLEALMNESYELEQLIERKQNKLSGTNGNLVTYGATAGTTGSKAIATTITNDANTVPNTQAVYNAVNERQIKIPRAGRIRDASGTMSAISDWTSASVKGTALVTKTTNDGVVGERKIFEPNATYTNNPETNIQIATIGAVMENTFTKTCAEYKPGTTGETAANCWLWEITRATCGANGTSCSSSSECCSGFCSANRTCATIIPVSCFNPSSCSRNSDCCDGYTCSAGTCARAVSGDLCGTEGVSCSTLNCCDGLTCDSRSNTCVREGSSRT